MDRYRIRRIVDNGFEPNGHRRRKADAIAQAREKPYATVVVDGHTGKIVYCTSPALRAEESDHGA